MSRRRLAQDKVAQAATGLDKVEQAVGGPDKVEKDVKWAPPYGLVQSSSGPYFDMQANVCDPTKTIVKRSLKTLNCSVVFRGSVKGSQRAGFLTIEYIRS